MRANIFEGLLEQNFKDREGVAVARIYTIQLAFALLLIMCRGLERDLMMGYEIYFNDSSQGKLYADEGRRRGHDMHQRMGVIVAGKELTGLFW